MSQIGIFDESIRLNKLSQLGDSLERLNEVIDWEIFRPILKRAIRPDKKDGRGRPPYDEVLMFKILVLQRIYNLSDDQMEFQINDRMTFMRFLGLSLGDRVPDAKTIWLFRDQLTKSGAIDGMFQRFETQLEEQHLITHTGTIVDATFVEAPKQRNTREENQTIKEGNVPEDWKSEENSHKLSQKDTDARWTIKNQERHYGYKDHVKADADSKLIVDYSVTPANVHDSRALVELIDEADQVLYADSAYSGEKLHASLPKSVNIQVHEKGTRDHPLTPEQKESNRLKSKVRAKIEHIFAHMEGSLHGITVRSIGLTRAKFNIGLMNLVYNIQRYEVLLRKQNHPNAG